MVNSILCQDNQTCLFVTVFCAILDIATGEIEFSNGGHNPPLVCDATGCFNFIKMACGFVVGIMADLKCTNERLRLKPGDTIFLYTDGVTEAMDPDRKQFGEERLREKLISLKDNGIKDMIQAMRREVTVFARGAQQSDDITMLAVRYTGAQKGAKPC